MPSSDCCSHIKHFLFVAMLSICNTIFQNYPNEIIPFCAEIYSPFFVFPQFHYIFS
ncbi:MULTISPECIES: hypothetical protein [Thermoanaerobacter]|uniref:hypothetical protein n=1 Tax=Thermoanaerobacter TaxID=1754 RepID=UPI00338F6F9C